VIVNVVESLMRGDIGTALHGHELLTEATPEGVCAVAAPSIFFQSSLQQRAVGDLVLLLQVGLEVFPTAENRVAVVVASPNFDRAMLIGLVPFPVVLAAKCLVTEVPSAAVRLLVSLVVLPKCSVSIGLQYDSAWIVKLTSAHMDG
jgi:hypothetical protein